MKICTLSLLGFISLSAWANSSFQCNRPVDPNKVVLFVDLNRGEPEINSARRAACARGEKLYSIPQDYTALTGKPLTATGAQRVDEDRFSEALEGLQSRGATLSSLIISGHDGGGSYAGDKGALTQDAIGYILEDYPQLVRSMSSLYLLGCYTTVKSGVYSWLRRLPQLEVIAGYEGRAPLASSLAGHTYLQDVLEREALLTGAENSASLNRILTQQIRNLGMIQASLYVRTNSCDEFLYRPLPLNSGDSRMETFSTSDCPQKLQEVRDSFVPIWQYMQGLLPIPENTTTSPLRALYNLYRSAEHCMSAEDTFATPNQLMTLLFFNDYRRNFAAYFSRDIESLRSAVTAITPQQSALAAEEEARELEQQAQQTEAYIARISADPTGALSRAQAENERAQKAYQDFFASPQGIALQNWEYTGSGGEVPAQLRAANQEKLRLGNAWSLANLEVQNLAPEVVQDNLSLKREQVEAFRRDAATIRQGITANADVAASTIRSLVPATAAELASMGRAELAQESHRLQRLASLPAVPWALRQRAMAMSMNINTTLLDGRMPFAWHDDETGPIGSPTTVATPSELGRQMIPLTLSYSELNQRAEEPSE